MKNLREKKVDLTIKLPNIKLDHAAALVKMFESMKILGNMGGSRWVCFYSDGDGNFRPKPEFEFSNNEKDILEFSNLVNFWDEEKDEYRIDFDAIAWKAYHNGIDL